MDNRENIIKWMHISDTHIGHNDYVEQAMRDKLPGYLKKIAPKKDFHLLMFTGDLIYAPRFLDQTSQLNDAETKAVCDFMGGIQRSLGVNHKRTCLAIGNHDLIRTQEKNAAVADILKGYRTGKGDLPSLDQILKAETRFAMLYRKILKRDYPMSGHYIETILLDSAEKGKKSRRLEILHLDTEICAEAVLADGKTRMIQDGNLIIGTQLLQEVVKRQHKPGNLIVAMGHHPLNTLGDEERDAVVRELESAGIAVYFCGHTHTSNIQRFGKKLVQVCCGTNMERKENGNPADMVFYTGEYDLVKKTLMIIPHQYYAQDGKEYYWGIAGKAPFQQTQFEKDINQVIFYYPRKKAPYSAFAEKYGRQLKNMINETERYVETVPAVNPKRPQISPDENIRKIYEADTGYGKTMYLKRMASEMILNSGEPYQDICDIVRDREIVFPFYVDLQSKQLGNKTDSISALLVKNICGGIRSDPEYKASIDWITKLAASGRMSLFVDGFERIGEKEREEFTKSLRQFLADYPDTEVSVASKSYIFDAANMQKQYESFSFWQLNVFDDAQIREYCRLWYESQMGDTIEDSDLQTKADQMAEQILADRPLKELAGIPLLLNTLLQVNKSINALPKSRIRLYDSFVFALLKDRPYPESDIRMLAVIAFEMRKDHVSSMTAKRIRRVMEEIKAEDDWLYDPGYFDGGEPDFLSAMNNNSRLLKRQSGSDSYTFYNDEIQDYFTSLALAKGYCADLSLWIGQRQVSSGTLQEYPLVREIKRFWDYAEDGNMILLTILQLNVYETSIVIEELLDHIASEDTMNGSSVETNSHLRNLLLRAILDGAYVCREQRRRAFETVQKSNLFYLQADILEEVFNSQFSSEFEATCSHYISALFRLLRDNCNPVQYLCDTICSGGKILLENRELEEHLYVLDGVIWSKGREYLDVYRKTNSIEALTSMLKLILQNQSVDALCKRRVCGVLHRLLTIGTLDNLDLSMIPAIFNVYEDTPPDLKEDSVYAGIRIFDAVPLNGANIVCIKSMNMSEERRKCFERLYRTAQNHQDKLSAFEAAVLCRCWDYDAVMAEIAKDDLFKSKIIDLNNLEARLQRLVESHFFE